MKRLAITSAIALFALATFATGAWARPPRVVVGYGGYWGPGWGLGWPYWGVDYAPPPPTTGKLDIDTSKVMKNDSVYIDGGYVGVAKHEKDLPLVPGTHQVELRAPNGAVDYQQSVNIALGHKTTVDAFANGVGPNGSVYPNDLNPNG